MVGGVRWGSRCGICSTPPGWGFFCVWATAPHACCWVQAKRYALSATPLCWPWGRFCTAARHEPFLCRPAALVYAGGMCAVFFGQPRRTGASAFRRRSVRSLVPGLAVRNAVARRCAPFAGAVSARFQRVRTAHSAGRVKKPGGQKEKVAKQRPRVVYSK